VALNTIKQTNKTLSVESGIKHHQTNKQKHYLLKVALNTINKQTKHYLLKEVLNTIKQTNKTLSVESGIKHHQQTNKQNIIC
jgi:hypothetical protein